MSWILTNSGIRFDLIMPTGNMVHPADIAHALAHLSRFTGHAKHHYSVAQHSLLVCDLVEDPELKLQALLHDATEAYAGDVATPLKQMLPEYKHIERRIWLAVCERFDVPAEMAPEVKRADLIALATERRDLMPAPHIEWEALQGVTPATGRIRQLSIDEVRMAYFRRLMDLMQADHRRACA